MKNNLHFLIVKINGQGINIVVAIRNVKIFINKGKHTINKMVKYFKLDSLWQNTNQKQVIK